MKRRVSEAVDLIKIFYRAIYDGDFEKARSILDPDVEWIEAAPEPLWFAGRHFGANAVVQDVIEPAQDKISQFQLKLKKFFALSDDTVVVLGCFRGRVRKTNLPLNARTAHIWTVANGKVVRFQGFHDVLEWQVAFGLTSLQTRLMAA